MKCVLVLCSFVLYVQLLLRPLWGCIFMHNEDATGLSARRMVPRSGAISIICHQRGVGKGLSLYDASATISV